MIKLEYQWKSNTVFYTYITCSFKFAWDISNMNLKVCLVLPYVLAMMLLPALVKHASCELRFKLDYKFRLRNLKEPLFRSLTFFTDQHSQIC